MSLVAALFEHGDLSVTEATGSAGRFVRVTTGYVPPWGASPDDPPLWAVESLDPRAVRELRDALTDWLDGLGWQA